MIGNAATVTLELTGRVNNADIHEEENLNESMIIWTKEFETGFATLDQQHRTLFEKINLLETLLHTTNPTREELEFVFKLVDYLEAYADFHFKAEENCMEGHNCPVHGQNQEAHEEFRGFIREYKRLCEVRGFKVELLRDLHAAMCSWIQDHILRIDTRLKPCIKT